MTKQYTAETAQGPLPRAWWFDPESGVACPIPYPVAGFDPMQQRVNLEQFWQDTAVSMSRQLDNLPPR